MMLTISILWLRENIHFIGKKIGSIPKKSAFPL